MSITFFIAPYTREDWIDAYDAALEDDGQAEPDADLRIDAKDYARALAEHWPLVEFNELAAVALSWILSPNTESSSGMRGHLYRNLQIVSFSRGPKEQFVDFILWHRAYVPAQQILYFFNSSAESSTEIKPDATENDIIKITGIVE